MSNLTVPLEDELGDVLEKAMRHAGLTEEALAARAGVPPAKILDAIDYRPDLSSADLRRLAPAWGSMKSACVRSVAASIRCPRTWRCRFACIRCA